MHWVDSKEGGRKIYEKGRRQENLWNHKHTSDSLLQYAISHVLEPIYIPRALNVAKTHVWFTIPIIHNLTCFGAYLYSAGTQHGNLHQYSLSMFQTPVVSCLARRDLRTYTYLPMFCDCAALRVLAAFDIHGVWVHKVFEDKAKKLLILFIDIPNSHGLVLSNMRSPYQLANVSREQLTLLIGTCIDCEVGQLVVAACRASCFISRTHPGNCVNHN